MSLSDELAKLDSLRASGALTEAEFAAAKARVLGYAPEPYLDVPAPDGYDPDRTPRPMATLQKINALRLSNADSVIGGVCGGLAAWSGVPAVLWRLGFVVGLVAYGIGVLPYVALWVCIPRAPR